MKTAVHTKTKQEFIELLQFIEKKGGMWCNGQNPTAIVDDWNEYQEQTCLDVSDIKNVTFLLRSYCQNKGYDIITPEQYYVGFVNSIAKMANIIKNTFKSEEQKALSHYDITNGDGSLTDNGRNEWIDYLWEKLAVQKDFVAKIIEAYKEEKK